MVYCKPHGAPLAQAAYPNVSPLTMQLENHSVLAQGRLRRKLRGLYRVALLVLISSFLYDMAFMGWCRSNGLDTFDSFLAQFSPSQWLAFWSSSFGAAVSTVYIFALVAAVILFRSVRTETKG